MKVHTLYWKDIFFLSSEPSWMVQKKNAWSMEVESHSYCYTQMAKALHWSRWVWSAKVSPCVILLYLDQRARPQNTRDCWYRSGGQLRSMKQTFAADMKHGEVVSSDVQFVRWFVFGGLPLTFNSQVPQLTTIFLQRWFSKKQKRKGQTWPGNPHICRLPVM